MAELIELPWGSRLQCTLWSTSQLARKAEHDLQQQHSEWICTACNTSSGHTRRKLPWSLLCVKGRLCRICLLYTSDAADEEDSVDLGGRRLIKKKKKMNRVVGVGGKRHR
eukprot:TRINITY_DN33596_c0_g1_i3.p1 TRINITY_DN33596_c0_g1~~TRINITY_DN33596_c0_g1_i3.p1  ORF type:complete len:110 (-),score=17.22 TRINITY_DN33596_c0_g1_i3:1-330(-)